MSEQITLQINGTERSCRDDDERSLLSVLREQFGLTGAKISCAEGTCGACTVLVDGRPTRACITPIASLAGRHVCTIEGVAAGGQLHPLQQAFLDHDAFQCGYCTPGMIMSALGLLGQSPHPNRETIIEHMQGNVCRCGVYSRIVDAIAQAAASQGAAQ